MQRNRLGSGDDIGGSGRVGSQKIDPCRALAWITAKYGSNTAVRAPYSSAWVMIKKDYQMIQKKSIHFNMFHVRKKWRHFSLGKFVFEERIK